MIYQHFTNIFINTKIIRVDLLNRYSLGIKLPGKKIVCNVTFEKTA